MDERRTKGNKSEDLSPISWILLLQYTGDSLLSFSTGIYDVQTKKIYFVFSFTTTYLLSGIKTSLIFISKLTKSIRIIMFYLKTNNYKLNLSNNEKNEFLENFTANFRHRTLCNSM